MPFTAIHRLPYRTLAAVGLATSLVSWMLMLDQTEGSSPPEVEQTKPQNAEQVEKSEGPWRAFGQVIDKDGRPMPGVEITAHCGYGSLRQTGVATSGADGRYELKFGPGIDFQTRKGVVFIQAATIAAHKRGFYEENLNRQGGCTAAETMPGEKDMQRNGAVKDRLFVPGRPLELNFVMRPAARVAGKLVDEQGRPLAGYSVSLTGADLPPSSNVLCSVRADRQGGFALENIPTNFRFRFEVRKADSEAPWDDSWASSSLRFERPDRGDLHAWFGNRELRLQQFVLRVTGPGTHWRILERNADKNPTLDLTTESASAVLDGNTTRLAAKSAVLTIANPPPPKPRPRLPPDPAVPDSKFKTRLARTKANEAGEFVISFENPPDVDPTPGQEQVIFQVSIGVSKKPIREKIFRQLEIRDGRYRVPVKVSPEWMNDSEVSIYFVTIQPNHEAWVKAFFHDHKGTSYSGLWIGDGGKLSAIPFEKERAK